jgi:hypothetical protein
MFKLLFWISLYCLINWVLYLIQVLTGKPVFVVVYKPVVKLFNWIFKDKTK